jgi:isopentenyl-diphosphate Delta-isomerase
VVVKEVGWGISGPVARQLRDAELAAIDADEAGGSSWSAVERERAASPSRRQLCDAFADWGIPTMESLRAVRGAAPGMPLIASGGLRTGVEAAKAIALGADLVGFAAPLLRAAAASGPAAQDALAATIEELRLAMFCCGAGDLARLREVARVIIDGVAERA